MSHAIARSLRWCITVELVLFVPLGALSLYGFLLSLVKSNGAALTNQGGLLQLGLIAVSIILGGACWTLWRGKASGRMWALAASAINLIGCVWAGHAASLPALFGLAGLVVFSRRDSVKEITAKTAKAPRVKGDGTSRLVDAIATGIQVLGVLYGLTWWDRWAYARGLPVHRDGVRILQILAVGLFLTAAHEFGHTVAGWAFRRKLRAFIVGPFQWRVREGRWTFQFQSAGLLTGGGAGLVSPSGEFRFGEEICVLLAGPLMNLLVGVAAVWAAITAVNRPWEHAWQVLALTGTLSLISFVVNLIPLRPQAAYSDGARVYQLLRGGSWVQLRRIQTMVAATTVSELRPRDYDIDAVQRAICALPQGMDGFLLRLHAHSYYLDRDQFPEALETLRAAEAFSNQAALNIPAELHTTFVFGYAFLRKDAVKARFWWDRMETRQPSRFNADYWLAKAALLWSENHLEEACQAWAKGNDQALKLPAVGTYEFDRRCFRQLRQVVESSVLSMDGTRWAVKTASAERDGDRNQAENEAHDAGLQQLAGSGSGPELSPA